MSYEPTNWKTGDVVTSDKLNKLENGVAESAGFLKVTAVTVDEKTGMATMDKTWQEIHDVLANGGYACVVGTPVPGNPVTVVQRPIYQAIYLADDIHPYMVIAVPLLGGTSSSFYCDTANDYPSYTP